MAEQLNRTVADVSVDALIYGDNPRPDTFAVTVASGQGKLARGTVLSLNGNGKAVIMGTNDGAQSPTTYAANCILCKDVDATSSDAVAIAYRQGHFAKDQLIVKEGYTLTASDIDTLRTHNIVVSERL
jgi:hypothetical protein